MWRAVWASLWIPGLAGGSVDGVVTLDMCVLFIFVDAVTYELRVCVCVCVWRHMFVICVSVCIRVMTHVCCDVGCFVVEYMRHFI